MDALLIALESQIHLQGIDGLASQSSMTDLCDLLFEIVHNNPPVGSPLIWSIAKPSFYGNFDSIK
jgi:hypothetical protein